MHLDKEHPELSLISWITRLAMVSLFAVAAIGKWKMGLAATASSLTGMFQNTWLPSCLVTPYAYAITFVETIVALWLLSGIKLRLAWTVTALFLITLAFGMSVAGQYAVASANYIYVMIACVGLYVSKYDCCALGCKK